MSYDVQIVADSIGPNGSRITTFALRYPRFIHAELMTHRAFSRNASSTRAIPTEKLIEWVEKDPAVPVFWGMNRKGMQAREELGYPRREYVADRWRFALHDALVHARAMMEAGCHKQIVGRILEPWAHINVVVTATSFDNFFALRCHKDAQPEIQVLAVRMARAYRDSTPKALHLGGWHLPFVDDDDPNFIGVHLKLSVARCARVSYKTFDGKDSTVEADIALHDRLLESRHMSPFEHQAAATALPGFRSGNLAGWRQYRKTLPFDSHESFDFDSLAAFEGRDFIV